MHYWASKLGKWLYAFDGAFYLKMWLYIFVVAVFVALLIQRVLLPYVFPSLHAGHGLLVGGDWTMYHEHAAELASLIRTEGWSRWQLMPDGLNSPIGIAAALYAATVAEPYVMIPLNAIMHATAGIALMMIMECLIHDRRVAFWSSLPMLAFPSAAMWYSQIAKDGFFVAGMLLILSGYVFLLDGNKRHKVSLRTMYCFVLLIGGAFLVWVVRPYMPLALLVIGVLLACWGSVLLWYRVRERQQSIVGAMAIAAVLFVVPFILSHKKESKLESNLSISNIQAHPATKRWEYTEWLPKRIDGLLLSIAIVRDGMVLDYLSAKSTIDRDFQPKCAKDFVLYFPRALQIAFLAPFPSQWVAKGSKEVGTIMRRAVSIEMLVIYASVALFPFSFLALRKRAAFWIVFLYSDLFLLLDAYIFPNLGTLHRMRYVFIMTFVSLSIGGAIKFFQERSSGNPPVKLR